MEMYPLRGFRTRACDRISRPLRPRRGSHTRELRDVAGVHSEPAAGIQWFLVEPVVRQFDSHAAAEAADRAYYRSLTPQFLSLIHI